MVVLDYSKSGSSLIHCGRERNGQMIHSAECTVFLRVFRDARRRAALTQGELGRQSGPNAVIASASEASDVSTSLNCERSAGRLDCRSNNSSDPSKGQGEDRLKTMSIGSQNVAG